MVIVLLTIFINGGSTSFLLSYFGIERGVNFAEYVDKVRICFYHEHCAVLLGSDENLGFGLESLNNCVDTLLGCLNP